MAYCECVVDPQHTLLPALLILAYMGGCIVSCINTGIFFQRNEATIAEPLVRSHLSFCIVGFAAFFCLSSLFWLWSAKYSLTRSDRIWRLYLGIWIVSLLKDLPLFVIESITISRTGWWARTPRSAASDLQCACYIMQIVFFVVSLTITGMSVSWYVAGAFERIWGTQFIMHVRKEVPPCVDYPVLAASSPPPLLLQEDALYSSPPGATAAYGGGPGGAPSPTYYERNYQRLNGMSPLAEQMLFSGPPVASTIGGDGIPPDVI